MKAYLDQLGKWWEALKPLERRWMVFIGGVVFVMVNYFYVWPHFNDYKKNSVRIQNAVTTNGFFQAEVNHQSEYKRKLAEMQSDDSSLAQEDQAIDFVHFYSSHAAANKVVVTQNGQLVTKTNDFSIDQQMGISVQADETNLVKFLYSLGTGSSAMRVRSMSMHPDPSHMQISAGLTLVASYQKKAPERVRGATTSAAPAPKATPPPVQKPSIPAPTTNRPAVQTQAPPTPNIVSNKLAGALSRHTNTNKPPAKPQAQQ
jgi:hypothetical protein